MNIHILSLFPESVKPYLNSSIMQRAQEKGLFRYFVHNLTDWTVRNTRRVDDRPYGGWAGTIITIEPLTRALRDIFTEYGEMPILLMSPGGTLLTAEKSEHLARDSEDYCIICGHYEWIDARIYELFDITELSIGEYVLSSGELGALVVIDSIVRLVPWVLSEESLREESFSIWLERKKEYPQYSRPEVFEGIDVPKVLLSGDQKKIAEWREKNLRD
jgi:tRNA (guanine37-N1)-methyltransferase